MFARNLLDERLDMRASFLSGTAWKDGQITPLNADMGTRRYLRISSNGRSAVLLESLPDGHSQASPGHRLDDWVRVNHSLAACGLSVPEIYAQDLRSGYMLIEDWGDLTFTKALDEGYDQKKLYGLATDALIVLNKIELPAPFPVPDFFNSHLPLTARRLVDWFFPFVRARPNEDGLIQGFNETIIQIKQNITKQIGDPVLCFSHTDFHPGNLMLLQRPGIKACGILDFQNPMHAPKAYDFINLLYDARRMPDDDVIKFCQSRYCHGMTQEEHDAFEQWGVYVRMLFHARVTGQFLKAGLMGHEFYMQFLPVVVRHLQRDLTYPAMQPLADFLAAHNVNLDMPQVINLNHLRGLISPDAV